MQQDIITNYEQRANAAQQEAAKYKKLANTYSLLRLSIFALIVVAISVGVQQDNFTIVAMAFVVLVFAFAWLVSRQSRFEKLKQYYDDLQKVNLNEIASIQSHANMYNDGARFGNEKHFYTSDLDIFGNASLYQLVNRTATSTGNNKLAQWFDKPATKATILQRQEAVKEIAGKNNWKLSVQTLLVFAIQQDVNQLKNLFKYLHLPLDMPGEKWLATYTKIAPYLFTGMLILAWFIPYARLAAIIIGIANMGIVFSKAVYISKADMIAGKIGDTLAKYADVFKHAEDEPWQASYNASLAALLKTNQTSNKIKELANLINKLNYHLNMVVGFVLNLFFLWDIRQVIAIENWKRQNNESLEAAFDVIAEFEALISLASLAINYPDWAYPQIDDKPGYTLIAQSLAHPLIDAAKRIKNNYELEDTHKIDIITGSNMAGKSTFLRTIGINTVLALCGAPVCAKSMRVSVITMISYMRIKDSLNESTSTFKAELDRLQMLLAAVENEPKIFFLIDEMLRGTNSVDKYLGSKAVIEQLIRKNAVGMVATHDLQIARLEDKYPDYVRNFYFDIQVKDGEMLFDYKIKHGECKTFNASLLLKQIGINVEAE
ncbi:MutS-related protein [Mucilaginibacter ginsenosidivorax]|uniref:DNA mismatch repair protein MutS n=1 Tax=Mucilaginibacter ginsenosidivorax TaxID=862126 RepID=A0A5B8VW24_9SPHI|nr:DNA mismatch repair protein MutS [Mucilaginibacter ginsenosidivorax]QEC75473.1 DNA mismatch repair protein MutS [Mucilaginibacter ginsenosidivorax]